MLDGCSIIKNYQSPIMPVLCIACL